MTEDFLHFIWKHHLFEKDNLYSSKGDAIEILQVGRSNLDAGPDFFDARIKINDVLWAGNVEIHVKSSYWHRHRHQNDLSYDNVILHVVYEEDSDVYVTSNRLLPCLELKFDEKLLINYNSLMKSQKWIPCFDEINKVDQFFIRNWLDRMVLERLEAKSKTINEILDKCDSSWEETCYQALARYFGVKVNSDPFQQLAQSIPLKVLARQKNSLFQIEAMLFGQAGMLEENECKDEYYQNLKKEYTFLANKYGLKSIPVHRWKWLRLRPPGFPTIRIAQFASLIYQSSRLFSKILEAKSYKELIDLFDLNVSEYWKHHYRFGAESKFREKKFGKATTDSLIINALLPLIFLYGNKIKSDEFKERALAVLELIPAENNAIISGWKKCGIKVKNAWHSQALLQLKSRYCEQSQCLQCEFGNRIIRMNKCVNTE